MPNYKLEVGYEGIPLVIKIVQAKNRDEAHDECHKLLNPDLGYNWMRVTRIPKTEGR
jgi:hypothetical protein